MSNSRRSAKSGVLVRFWTLDHHRGERVNGPPSSWPMLVYAESGALFLEFDDRKWTLTANRALMVPRDEKFSMQTLAPARVRSLYFGPEYKPKVANGPIGVSPLMRELILAVCERGPLLASRPEHAALAEVLRHELAAAPSFSTGLPWPVSQPLRRFASEALLGSTPLRDLIANSGCSRRTLERAMVSETRLSLGRWLRQARMTRAIVALTDGASVADAAIVAGYSEPSAFIYAFRRAHGTTPGSIRGQI